MSDIKYIRAQVFMAGLYPSGLLCPGAANKEAVSSEMQVAGEEWFVPFTDNGIFDRYDRVIQTTAPTPDAVRAVRLRDPQTGQTIWILGTMVDWTDRVNACCGSTPEMPDVTLPDVLAEEFPCPIVVCTPEDATYTFVDAFMELGDGDVYLIAGSANGAAMVPAAPQTGFANGNSLVAWVQANWGAYGTWSVDVDDDTDQWGLKLVSETTKRGFVQMRTRHGAIGTLGAITAGSLYTNGVYPNRALTSKTGSGKSATANITVAGGAVTAVALVSRGENYQVADVLTVVSSLIGGTGSGFSIPVATLQAGV